MGYLLDALPQRTVWKVIPNLIVPVLNRYDLLERMVASIDYPVKHLLIIDNGNQLDQLHVPECVEQWTVLTMPANLGVASSWNLGIKCFPFDSVWYIASDDIVFEPGGLEALAEWSDPDRIVVSDSWPHWQLFAVGDGVVDAVGLFDEAIHPANFEDDDYEWRCNAIGIDVERRQVDHSHVKQGTVFSPQYAERNQDTYRSNEEYFRLKQLQGDLTSGEWSLERRRDNSWDMPVD